MSRSSRDVGGYRGRRTITDILRIIAVALAVAVVLVLAGLFFLQRYIVYTDDGMRLDLPPFLQAFRQGDREPEEPPLPDLTDISVVEDNGTQPEPEPERPGFGVQLTVDEVVNGTAAARLEELGAEALVLEVKDQLGQLAWQSGQAMAGRSEVNGSQAVGEALKRWNEGDIYTVARVHCFRDDTVPYYNNNFALRWAGNNWNWRDELGLRWTSPAREEIRAYNAALCGELAAMGFDEIVLEECCFPIGGKLDTIKQGESYEPVRFTAQLEDFLTRVRQAVEPYGTKISLRVERETLAGEESVSGVTLQLLEQYADRIWTGPEGLSALPVRADGTLPQAVEIVPQAEEDRAVFQAVIPEQIPPTPKV